MTAARLAPNLLAWSVPLLLVVLPLGSFLIVSFWRVENNALVPAFTFANYLEFAHNEIYPRVLRGTLPPGVPGHAVLPRHRLSRGPVRVAPAGTGPLGAALRDRPAPLLELHHQDLRDPLAARAAWAS